MASEDDARMASEDEDDELVPDISNTDDKESTATDDDVASSEPAEADLTVGLSLAECVEKAIAHKAEGNEHFKASRSREAVACYGLGVRYLTKHKLEAEARPLLVALHTNSAACHIREEAWAEAIAAANSSVEIDLTHKALYRRGVAYARLGQLDEAKDDLATVCRADAKNRDARSELTAVNAALKARKEGERKAYGSMFSGKSMYREEELRERRRLDEERQGKERERQAEARLKEEWREECARLRGEAGSTRERLASAAEARLAAAAGSGAVAAAASPDDAAAVEPMSLDPPPSYAAVSGDASAGGEAAAGGVEDVEEGEGGRKVGQDEGKAGAEEEEEDMPISFADFKKQKEEAKKAREEEEKAARERALGERQKARAKTDVVRVDDEDDLKDMIKGYKKTADGKTTSYFTREVDAETKAMLDELKQPKRLDPQLAAAPAVAPGASSRGSAWNAAGTWEEKDLSKWAQDALTARLKGLHASASPSAAEMQAQLEQQLASLADAADAGAAEGKPTSGLEEAMAPLLLKVSDVKKCEGSASVQSSRGRVKHVYDLTFEIDWEATLQPLTNGVGADAGASPKKPGAKCKGTLSYAEVTSAAASDASKYEVNSKFKKVPTAALKARAEAGVELLRAEVAKALEAFAAEFKTKVI